MDEKDAAKNEGEQEGDAGRKKDDGTLVVVVVLKLVMHCERCMQKAKKVTRRFDGVEDAKADLATDVLTVTGKVNAVRLLLRLRKKLGKRVELVSLQPKEPRVITMVLKLELDFEASPEEIKRTIRMIKGVKSMTVDEKMDLVTEKGTMDPKVEVVPPAKKEKEGGGEKKEKGGGGEKKDGEAKASSSGGDGSKSVVSAYNHGDVPEYYGYAPTYASPYARPPMYASPYAKPCYQINSVHVKIIEKYK